MSNTESGPHIDQCADIPATPVGERFFLVPEKELVSLVRKVTKAASKKDHQKKVNDRLALYMICTLTPKKE